MNKIKLIYIYIYIVGTAFRMLGNFEDATKCYDKAIELNENLYLTWYYKGLIEYKINNIDCAIVYFYKSIDIESSFHKGWYRLGLCYLKKDDVKKSYKCFKHACELDKNNEKYKLKVDEIKFDYTIISLSDALTKFQNLNDSSQNDFQDSPRSFIRSLKEGTIEVLKKIEIKLSQAIRNSKAILYIDSPETNKDLSTLCVICLEKLRCKVCIPCNHLCLCEECFKKVELCPICRKKIESFLRVYV